MMYILNLRFEHGAGGTPFKAAQELCEMASKFQLSAHLNVNGLGDMFALPGEEPEDVFERWKLATAARLVDVSGRPTTYMCEFCGAASLKDAWGPGRITCPICKKIARAADGTDRNR